MTYRFHKAARDGYLDLLREASRKDADSPDEDGMTPVHWAAYHGNLDALRMLLGRGGNPDKCDYVGNTALHFSCQNGHMNCVSYLVSFGANLWALDNDFHTCLEAASLNDRVEIVRFLDDVIAKQAALNKSYVKKLKEKAVVSAEKRIKEYAKLTAKAQKKAEKEEMKMMKRMSITSLKTVPEQNVVNGDEPEATSNGGYLKNGHGGSVNHVPNTWTSRHQPKMYSDYVGTTGSAAGNRVSKLFNGTGRSGASKKIMSKKKSERNSGDFKVGTVSDGGKRSVTSLSGLTVRRDSEVLYVQDNNRTRKGLSDDLFDTTSEASVAMSVPDMNYQNDQHDPGSIFNRPGLGAISFLRNVETLRSLPSEIEDNNNDDDGIDDLPCSDAVNGQNHDATNGHSNNDRGADVTSIGTVGSLAQRIQKIVPWDEDEIAELDDDEEIHENSSLEVFLAAHGMSEYLTLLTKEKIDLEALMLCSDADLKEIGLPLGPRRKIIDGVCRRKEVLQSDTSIEDTQL